MNDRTLDAVIRAALAPSEDVRSPIGMADEIHRRLLATPQEAHTGAVRMMRLGRVPVMSPTTLLLLLLLAVAGIAVGAALLLPERNAPTDVLTFRGGHGRTGVVVGPAPVGEPLVEWEVRLPRGLKDYTMPLVSDGVVYVVDVRGDALALDLETGVERWSVALPADVSGTPLIARGLLIVPADDGIVRALNLASGTIVWSRDLGARAGSSVGGWGDLAFVGADDGRVHALDVATGQERWTVDAGGPVVKAPAIEDGIALVVVNDGPVTAFDVATGEVRWRSEVGPGTFATPAVAGGVLYLAHGVEGGSEPFELAALDVRDAGRAGPNLLWRWQAPPTIGLYVGAVTPEAVYALSADHDVYEIDPVTGEGRVLLETGGALGSPAAVAGHVLYVASQDELVYAIDRRTREVLWTAPVDGWPASPVAAVGRLIVGTEFGQLISLVEGPEAAPARATDP